MFRSSTFLNLCSRFYHFPSTIFALCLSASVSLADVQGQQNSSNVIDLKEAHINLMIKGFLGTFEVHTSGEKLPSLASIAVEDSRLVLWTQAGKGTSSDFQLDLDKLNTEIATQHMRNKLHDLYTTSIELHELSITKASYSKTYFNKSQMSVDEAAISIEDKNLVYSFKRTYFKRANVFYGPWVEDRTRKSLNIQSRLVKVSNTPIHRDDLAKIRPKSNPNYYSRVSKANSIQLNELIRNEFEDLHKDKKAFALALQKLERFNIGKIKHVKEAPHLPPYTIDALRKNIIIVDFKQFNMCDKFLLE